MLVPAELMLVAVLLSLLVGITLGGYTLRTSGGLPWLPAWGVALFGAICFLIEQRNPLLEGAAHTAAQFYPVLFVVGSLLYVGRRVPSWLVGAGFAVAALRGGLAALGYAAPAYVLALATTPVLVGVAAELVRRHVVLHREPALHRAIATGFFVFAGLEVVDSVLHLTGIGNEFLWPIWITAGILLATVQIVAVFERAMRERRNAEQALDDNERRFLEISRGAYDLILEFDTQGHLAYASPGIEAALGATPEEVVGRDWRDWIHPDDLGLVERAIREANTHASVRPAPARIRHADGGWRWIEATARQYQRRGEDNRVLLVARDVTARQEAEEALRAAEQRVRAILSSMGPLRPVLLDLNGRVLSIFGEASEPMEAVYGIRRSEATGLSISDFLPGDESRRLLDSLRNVFETGEACDALTAVELPNGTFYFKAEMYPMRRTNGKVEAVLAVVKDVTQELADAEERGQLEAQAQRALRLESLEQLAGGIAHDFNNLLMAIQGNAELVLGEIDPDSRLRPLLEDMDLASEQAAALTQQLLAYSGGSPRRSVRFDIEEVVSEVVQRARSSMPSSVQLEWEGGPPCWVRGDRQALAQGVGNLMQSALDSLPHKTGRIELRTGTMHLDREHIAHCAVTQGISEGAYTFVEVRDTGQGIHPDDQARIFDPFFAAGSRGRGLGLAEALGVARSHGGTIEVESTPDHGATFRVFLPISSGVPLPEEPPVARGDRPTAGTVLVVDDQRMVRAVAERMLVQQGFQVHAAESGAEALAYLREHGEEIVCVLLDLSMPGMTGEETLDALRELRPELPAVLMSGYSDRQLRLPLEGRSRVTSLQKPFRTATLAEVIRDVLGS